VRARGLANHTGIIRFLLREKTAPLDATGVGFEDTAASVDFTALDTFPLTRGCACSTEAVDHFLQAITVVAVITEPLWAWTPSQRIALWIAVEVKILWIDLFREKTSCVDKTALLKQDLASIKPLITGLGALKAIIITGGSTWNALPRLTALLPITELIIHAAPLWVVRPALSPLGGDTTLAGVLRVAFSCFIATPINKAKAWEEADLTSPTLLIAILSAAELITGTGCLDRDTERTIAALVAVTVEFISTDRIAADLQLQLVLSRFKDIASQDKMVDPRL